MRRGAWDWEGIIKEQSRIKFEMEGEVERAVTKAGTKSSYFEFSKQL